MTYLTVPQVLIPAFAGMTEEGQTAQGNLKLMHDLLPRGVARAGEIVELGPRALRTPRQQREPAEPNQEAGDCQIDGRGEQPARVDVSGTDPPAADEREAPQDDEQRPEQLPSSNGSESGPGWPSGRRRTSRVVTPSTKNSASSADSEMLAAPKESSGAAGPAQAPPNSHPAPTASAARTLRTPSAPTAKLALSPRASVGASRREMS